MKTVLVTGATGFIGNYVVDRLLKKGFKVIATSSQLERACLQTWFDKVTYIPFDFSTFDDNTNYFDYFQQPHLLIHLAWQGLPNYKSEFHITENLPKHVHFLKNLIDNGLNDLTITGTCLEYGMKEGCLAENVECTPTNAYGIAKNELRKYLEIYTSDKKVDFKWVRLFFMFGKGQNQNSLFAQLENAIIMGERVFNMSRGDQLRDYLPIESVAEYIVDISLQNRITGIINCCSGKPVKIIDFIKKFIDDRASGIELNKGFYPYPDYEPMAFWGDNSKLRLILNKDSSN